MFDCLPPKAPLSVGVNPGPIATLLGTTCAFFDQYEYSAPGFVLVHSRQLYAGVNVEIDGVYGR